jgi:replicative DNA helicase
MPLDSSPLLRSPPHNVEAAKALLGAIMVYEARAWERLGALAPKHFAVLQHRRIFEACRRLVERGQIANPVTLRRFFEADASLAEIGGPAYLGELAECAATPINAGEYARIIRSDALKRSLVQAGTDLTEQAYSAGAETDAAEVLASHEAALAAGGEQPAVRGRAGQ